MPVLMAVHSPGCMWESGACHCIPLTTTDAEAAKTAHQGDSKRMQLLTVSRPPVNWTVEQQPIPYHRSQARRHVSISE